MQEIAYINKMVTFKFLVSLIVLFSLANAHAGNTPWRLNNALNAPPWLSISGQHRIRFETLDEQFRSARTGGDQALFLRTNILLWADFNKVKFVVEGIDSRGYLVDSGTPQSTGMFNPFELLQAYAEFNVDDLFVEGSKSRFRGGRLTMDVGSRRLVARNRFRNTLNAFTGVDWQWAGPDETRFRAFYVLPIQRRVHGEFSDNKPEFDAEHTQVSFWGIYYATAKLPWGDNGEVYLFGLNEDDVSRRPTRNRDLYTTGFRIYRPPARNSFDYQLESIYQFGEARTLLSATADQDHFAHFQHLEVGYTFDSRWSPQLLLQYDYASGDDNALDDDSNRFSTLYGARRFDYGPTSIYGPFIRGNISTPGLRLKLKPGENISSFLSLRGFWMASDDDGWIVAGLVNAPGSSNTYIGTQIEARVRWEVLPKNIRIEAGAAHLFAGDMMDAAGKDDTNYLYSQLVFTF